MTEASATVRPGRKITGIWVIPIVATLLGLWMVIYNYINQGPEITITFSSAAGIQAGKTKIKALNVELGVVDSVELSEDLNSVVVRAQLEHYAIPLLKDDTQFWVVRPRVGPGGISGLGTILSGGYIKLEDGKGKAGQRNFIGLDSPPVTPAGTPGLQITLESERLGSVSQGDPVMFRGFRVGQIETTTFDVRNQKIAYRAFIEAPYDALINTSTRFWNASGIYIDASAEGVEVDISSLQSLLVGGVAFDVPEDKIPGPPAKNGAVFKLYPNKESVKEKIYENFFYMIVAFSQSISGLLPGAPIEYRGIRVGTVERVLLEELANSEESRRSYGSPIPVLVKFEPGRFGLPDTQESVEAFRDTVGRAVSNGLRATLITGNIITGQLLISFDYYPDAPPAKLEEYFGYMSIPTLPGGIQRIQEQITLLLAKLNELPLESAVAEMQSVLEELSATLDSFSPDSETGEQLNKSLSEINRTLRNIDNLTRQLSDKPNSIIFSPPVEEDPVPVKGDSP